MAYSFSTLSQALKGSSNPGQNAAGDSEAIREKMNNINSYKNSLPSTSAPQPGPHTPTQTSPVDLVHPNDKAPTGRQKLDKLNQKYPGLPKLAKGAKIKKTRVVKVHAKEVVLPKGRAKKAEKMGLTKGLQSL